MSNILNNCFIFIFLFSIPTFKALSKEDSYTLGIVPQQAASKLAKKWLPICKFLSERLGYKVVFKTAPNIPEFEKRLKNGEYDFAYMNPYHYTVFSKVPGYQAISKAKNKKIKGILVGKKGSSKNLKILANQSLAFPSPAAFAASILPKAELKKQGVPFTPKYVSSHDSVYKAVAKGIYPAGGGVVRTFNNVDENTREKLEIIFTTRGFTPHAIAYKSKIPEKIWQSFQTILIDLENDEVGKKLLMGLSIQGFEKAKDEDWNDVRNLNIDML